MLRATMLRTATRAMSQSVRFNTTAAAANAATTPSTTSPAPTDNALVQQRPAGTLVQAGIISGAPEELHRRPVRIYRPAPPSTQSAKCSSHSWVIDWDILQGAGRWENPLMGWASTADYMQATNLKFGTREQAVAFCERQGFEYFVQEPKKSKSIPKSYSSNYAYTDKPLRQVVTK